MRDPVDSGALNPSHEPVDHKYILLWREVLHPTRVVSRVGVYGDTFNMKLSAGSVGQSSVGLKAMLNVGAQ